MKELNLYLVGSAMVAALGGLLFGFDTAVISGTTHWLKGGFVLQITSQVLPHLTGSWFARVSQGRLLEFMLGLTVASALIGTVVGSIAVGRPADAVGRRGVLFVLALLYVATALGCGLAWDWWPSRSSTSSWASSWPTCRTT
jgi:MFS family permease